MKGDYGIKFICWIIGLYLGPVPIHGYGYDDCISDGGANIQQKICLRLARFNSEGCQPVTIPDLETHKIYRNAALNLLQTSTNTVVVIGLSKVNGTHKFNDFVWSNGEIMTYTAWKDTSGVFSPNLFGMGKCFIMTLNKTTLQTWEDISCDKTSTYNTLCQYKRSSTSLVKLHTFVQPAPNDQLNYISQLNTFLCDNKERISNILRCDGNSDCSDNSDERSCPFGRCRKQQFRCHTGHCIPLYLQCNYKPDCPDGSDELNCRRLACLDFVEWRCESGQCIPKQRKCDGIYDCFDHSDESKTNCEGASCTWHLNNCDGGTEKCYAKKLYCDGVRDCVSRDENTGCLRRKLYPSCYAFHMKENKNALAKIDFGIEDLGATDVACSMSADKRVYVIYPRIDHGESGIEIGVNPVQIQYSLQDIFIDKILSISSKCTQHIRISCDREGDSVKDMYWGTHTSGGPVFRTQSCNSYCQCEYPPYCTGIGKRKRSLLFIGGGSFGWGGGESKAPSCECVNSIPTPPVDRGHCQYSGWVAITDKRKLPVRRLFLKTGGMKAVIGNIQCIEDEETIKSTIPSYNEMDKYECKNGLFTYKRYRCVLEMGPYGQNYGCRDLSHLENCGNFSCPVNTVKCPNSFCLHNSLICDGIKHCPNGDDEFGCIDRSCRGTFKCSGSTEQCIPLSKVCDGLKHCKEGEDEANCETACPADCTCLSQGNVVCKNISPDFNTSHIKGIVRLLDLSYNTINSWISFSFDHFNRLEELVLENCGIIELKQEPFSGLFNLRILDLSFNRIKKIYQSSFPGLLSLRSLILFGNFEIEFIEANSFFDQIYLQKLSISSTLITSLVAHTFNGMIALRTLDLSFNRISQIENGAFHSLYNLRSLDLRGNDLVVTKAVFSGIAALDEMVADSYTFCCESPKSDQFTCKSPNGDIYTCTDLIGHQVLQTITWVMTVLLLLTNGCVLVYRLLAEREHSALGVYMGNLHVANFMYGIYMGAVASADTKYRGIYLWREYEWRSSPVCRIAGVVGTTSTMVSIILICLMTIDLWYQIYPKSEFRFRPHHALKLGLCAWGISVIIGAVPVNETYSISATCFFLPITDLRRAGYTFAAILFVFVNSGLCISVCIAFFLMNKQNIRKWKMENLEEKTLEEINLSSVRAVVFTDCLLWWMISIMGICSLSGYALNGAVYGWVIFFLFPLNGVLNPLLYIYSSNYKAMQREQFDKKQAEIVGQFGTAYDHPLFYQTENHNSIRRHLGCMYLETGNCFVSMNDAYIMLTRTAECLAYLHSQGMVHGRVSDETVSIVLNEDNKVTDSNLMLKKKKKKHLLLKYEDDVFSLGELGRGLCRRIQ